MVRNLKMSGNFQESSTPTSSTETSESTEPHEELQYLDLIKKILATGVDRPERNLVRNLSIFGNQMRFNLRHGTLPLFTTRPINFEYIAKELLWFISSSTFAQDLQTQGVHIWDWNTNSTRVVLDSRGFMDRKEGDLGPVYGFQWQHYGAEYERHDSNYLGQGHNQLGQIMYQLTDTYGTNSQNGRRIVICSWNVTDIDKMALPPYHCFLQFYVANGELSSQLYTRSADVGIDLPASIALYALLTHMVAHVTNLKPGEFIHVTGDTHIYKEQVDRIKVLLEREPKPFPKLEFKQKVMKIGDFKYEDLILHGYKSHPPIRIPMMRSNEPSRLPVRFDAATI